MDKKVIDPNLVKEKLSEHFAGILFHLDGYFSLKAERDDGVDIKITYTKEIDTGKKKIRNQSEESVDLQLKATTERQIKRTTNSIIYQMKVKSYNKLVDATKTRKYTPYILVLFILPDEEKDWIALKNDSISLFNKTYWYIPPASLELEKLKSENSTVNIEIPNSNVLAKDAFSYFFSLIPK